MLEKGAKTDVKAANGFTIEDVFYQKDWSYAEKYKEIVEKNTTKEKIIKKYSLEEAIVALKENNFELFKEIIETQPAIVNKKEVSDESSLLHYAVAKNNKQIIEL